MIKWVSTFLQQFLQQQVNPQQNYPHDISKQLNNQQLVQGQALAQQQNMYQQQQQRTPAVCIYICSLQHSSLHGLLYIN